MNQGNVLAPICLVVLPAAPSASSRDIRSLCPHNVKMFEPHKLSEIMSALFSRLLQRPGAFQASAASRVRGARAWSFAGATDGVTAGNTGGFTEGASGHRGFPFSLGNVWFQVRLGSQPAGCDFPAGEAHEAAQLPFVPPM